MIEGAVGLRHSGPIMSGNFIVRERGGGGGHGSKRGRKPK